MLGKANAPKRLSFERPKKIAIDKNQISPPILPPGQPPRVMIEANWPGRIIDGIDRTFPVEWVVNEERRGSLYQEMARARAFVSEQHVPQLTQEARARMASNAPLSDSRRGSPLRPPLKRGSSTPTRLPSLPEHEPLTLLQPLSRSDKHPRPVFSDPFAPVAQGASGEQRVAIEVQSPNGSKTQPVIPGAAKNVSEPSRAHTPAAFYRAPSE